MSKKKDKRNISKIFNNRADIITNDNNIYHIRKNRVYICKSNYYGKVYTISSNRYNKNNVHIIREFYDNDKDENRLRFRILNLHNAKKFKTIEKLPDGKERKIAVIEDYDDSSEYICSIGNIKCLNTDMISEKKNHLIKDIKILKLVLSREHNNREENNKKVA